MSSLLKHKGEPDLFHGDVPVTISKHEKCLNETAGSFSESECFMCSDSDTESHMTGPLAEYRVTVKLPPPELKTKSEESSRAVMCSPLIFKYTCQICSYGADSLHNFNCHVRMHRAEKPYMFVECNFSVSTWSCRSRCGHLHTGANVTSPAAKSQKCDYCKYSTSSLYNFWVHKRIHTGQQRVFEL